MLDAERWEINVAEDRPRRRAGTGVNAVIRARRRLPRRQSGDGRARAPGVAPGGEDEPEGHEHAHEEEGGRSRQLDMGVPGVAVDADVDRAADVGDVDALDHAV